MQETIFNQTLEFLNKEEDGSTDSKEKIANMLDSLNALEFGYIKYSDNDAADGIDLTKRIRELLRALSNDIYLMKFNKSHETQATAT